MTKLAPALALCGMLAALVAPAQAQPVQVLPVGPWQTGGQPAIPDLLSRCLARNQDTGELWMSCTQALEFGGLSGPLLALAYNARGEANCQRAEYDFALDDQNKAIALVPNFPQAYADRAHCHIGKKDLPAAIADYDQAIALAPLSATFRSERAKAYNETGKHDLALADYAQAISINPQDNGDVFEEGVILFGLGRYDEAVARFKAVVPTMPDYLYGYLWLHIARLRAQEPDTAEFKASLSRHDLGEWPGPLFEAFSGAGGFAALDADIRSGRYGTDTAVAQCTTAFYEGENDLAKGDTAAAKTLIDKAVSLCDSSYNEYLPAWAEAKRMTPAALYKGPW